MPTPHQPAPTPEEISAHAHQLWLIAGSPPGGADAFRGAAESELRQQREVTDRAADDPLSDRPARQGR